MIEENEQSEDSGPSDFDDQYIAVLLEHYAVRVESSGSGPAARAKVRYWDRIVKLFERAFPDDAARKARYRAQKAENLGRSPLETAFVRFSWMMFLCGLAGEREVKLRWLRYLGGDPPQSSSRFVTAELFHCRRQLDEMCAALVRNGLWPWPNVKARHKNPVGERISAFRRASS